MLHEVYYWLFNMSITAAITGLLIMLIRSIRVIPRRLAVILWSIPFLRMIVPLGLNSPYSFMTLLSKFATKTVVVYQHTEDIAFSLTNTVLAADTYFPITYKVNVLESVFHIAAIVWIVIFLVILLTLTIVYFSTLHEMKDAVHLHDNIFISEHIASPAVYGIIKPRIVFPVCFQDTDNELIMLHENVHIRRRDNLRRLLAIVITAIHWFNPLCWIFLKLFLVDLELACDEQVLAVIGRERANEYAQTLLTYRQSAGIFSSSFGGAKIRRRIENILSFRKLTWFSLTAFTLLIVAIFYTLLTNAG